MRSVPGIKDDRHYNHMPEPAKRINLTTFMEKLLCSPTSASKHETRQTHLGTRKSPATLCRCHLWWFANSALAAEVAPRSAGIANADLATKDWDFRFYYLGCEHEWALTTMHSMYDRTYTCSLCGAVERWDSS